MWSNTDYTSHLITTLPKLIVLDQNDVTPNMRRNAVRWKEAEKLRQEQQQQHGQMQSGKSQAARKMEERSVSISNAKRRWDFLKQQDWTKKAVVHNPDNENSAVNKQ